jgi:hypothetical protein
MMLQVSLLRLPAPGDAKWTKQQMQEAYKLVSTGRCFDRVALISSSLRKMGSPFWDFKMLQESTGRRLAVLDSRLHQIILEYFVNTFWGMNCRLFQSQRQVVGCIVQWTDPPAWNLQLLSY